MRYTVPVSYNLNVRNLRCNIIVVVGTCTAWAKLVCYLIFVEESLKVFNELFMAS